jgi:phosphoribosylaminoimidazole-succinocarboxamide synthase
VLLANDQQSAFDCVPSNTPFKGQVLNQTSTWWFNRTKDIVRNALIVVPASCVTGMRKCDVFPVYFVICGYMTDSAETPCGRSAIVLEHENTAVTSFLLA